MKNSSFVVSDDSPLYIQLYMYFRRLIETGQIKSGSKLMSIRRCCNEFELSKTTVETAYLQLAAEGYIISKPQSGYYVTDIELIKTENVSVSEYKNEKLNTPVLYDFSSTSPESGSFDFSIWSRYIKSALRQNDRLLTYGEAQGEVDLRKTISEYINKSRSVFSSPENIVIGAGTQGLINILCSIIKKDSVVAFVGTTFEKGEAVFEDHGCKCLRFSAFPEDLSVFKENNVKLIYISPSHFTIYGDILPIKQRTALINFAKENDCMIIEDDYDSEFRYYSKPVPSLQGIASGNNVIYLGTFSKLLIPSIRISFMVLPNELMKPYSERGNLYNQTASKLEQIAVCQFIRDGHMNFQIKKQRKEFNSKANILCEKAKVILKNKVEISLLPAGYLVKFEFNSKYAPENFFSELLSRGVKVIPVKEAKQPTAILSSTGVSINNYDTALEIINSVLN